MEKSRDGGGREEVEEVVLFRDVAIVIKCD